MPPSPVPAPDLAALLAALRHAGLRVGPTEVLRLRAVLGTDLPADTDPARLRGILAALLVKGAEDRERFDRVFADWSEEVDAAVGRRAPVARTDGLPSRPPTPRPGPVQPAPRPGPVQPAPAPPPPAPAPRRRWLVGMTVALVLLLAGGGVGVRQWLQTEPVRDPPKQPVPPVTKTEP